MSDRSDADAPELDLKQILAQLLARKWLIISLSLLGAVIGLAIAVMPANEYTSRSVVQIERRSDGISLPAELIGELLTGAKGGGTNSNFATEIHVIKSRIILEPAAQELGLLTRVSPKTLPLWGDFIVRSGLADRIPPLGRYIPPAYSRGGESLSVARFDLTRARDDLVVEVTAAGEGAFTLSVAGETYAGALNAPITLGDIGTIVIDEMDAAEGRVFYITRLPTRFVVGQLSRGLDVRERSTTGIIDFAFTGQDRDAVVPILNTIVETYQAANLQRRSAEIDQSIVFISDQLRVLRQDLVDAQRALVEFRNENGVGELSVGTQDLLSHIVELETNIERLDFEIEEVLKRVTPNHPDYQRLASERGRVNERLIAAKRDLETVPEAEQNLALLTRELERARSLELQLTERVEQLRILKASAVGNVRVLEPAEMATLSGPDRLTPVLLGIFAGFGLASLWIFAVNYLRTGIEDGRDIEALGLPLFATISDVPPKDLATGKDAPPLAVTNATHPSVEAFRALRTGLQFSLSSAGHNVVLITSSAPSEGKSFVSQNLAVVLASAGRKVLLIDADMRRGKLRRAFGLSGKSLGLSELLASPTDAGTAIHATAIDGLDVIPTGKRPPNPAELLDKQIFKDLIEWAKSEYDYVVIDAPPVLAVSDPLIIANVGVVTLIVVKHTKTTASEITATLRAIDVAGFKASGAILNGYDQRRSKYGSYGYKYGYYYGGYSYNYKDGEK